METAEHPSGLPTMGGVRSGANNIDKLHGSPVATPVPKPSGLGSPNFPRLDYYLSEQRSLTGQRAAETATSLPSVFAPIEDKELELAVLAKGREVELTRLLHHQQQVYDECVAGALQCQSLVERKEQLRAQLIGEAQIDAAAVRAIKENHEIIKQRTRELHLKNVAAHLVRAGATDSDLFNSQEHQRRLLERRCLDLERKLVSADKALRKDRSRASLQLLQSTTEQRRLDARNEARQHSLAYKKAAEAEISARLQRTLCLAPGKEEFGLLMPHPAMEEKSVDAQERSSVEPLDTPVVSVVDAGWSDRGGTAKAAPRLNLDLLGRSVLDVDQFDALRTPEQRRKCLELLQERFTQLSSLVTHLRKLLCVTKTLHADFNLRTALDNISTMACDACEAGTARILLIEVGQGPGQVQPSNNTEDKNEEQKQQLLHVNLPQLCFYVGDDLHHVTQSGITAQVIATGRTEVVLDITQDPRYRGTADNPTSGGCKSLIISPIWEGEDEEKGAGSRVIGVLQVANKVKGDFNAKDALCADLLATATATATSNARSYLEVTQQRGRNRALLDAGRVLASSVDHKTVLDRAVVETRRIMRAEIVLMWSFAPLPAPSSGCVRTLGPNDSVFDDTFSDPMVDSRMFGGGFEAAARRCVTEGRIIAVPDAYVDDTFSADFDRRLGIHTGSVMCAPVTGTTGKSLGAIVCINKLSEQSTLDTSSSGGGKTGKGEGRGRGGSAWGPREKLLAFNVDDEEAMRTLAVQVGVALENAILYTRVSQVPDISGDLQLKLSISEAGHLVLDRAMDLCPCYSARLCVVGGANNDEVWFMDDRGGDGTWMSLPPGSKVGQVLAAGKTLNFGETEGELSASLKKHEGFNATLDLPAAGEGGEVTSLLYAPLPLLVATRSPREGKASLRASGVLILANKKEGRTVGGSRNTAASDVKDSPVFDRMDEYLVGGYLSSAAVVLKAAEARELSVQAEARWEVLSQTVDQLYGHDISLGVDMPHAPFEEFASTQVEALLPNVSLKVCWPKQKESEEAREESTEPSIPVFEDTEAATALVQGPYAISRPREDSQSLATHIVAAPVKTTAGLVRCCLVATREGGRSFSSAEVEALTVFSGHVGLCMS